MKTIFELRQKTRGPGLLTALMLGLVWFATPGSLMAQYLGADGCLGACHLHEDQYREWQNSGHRFILNEAEVARHRSLPLPAGTDWVDFSYVVGGNKTKALFLDTDGYIYTPPGGENQYNLLTGEWTDFHPGEDKPYDCGRCHTTGYEASGFPAGLPGISGTFALPGVQCEHCHGGPGAMEAADPAICQDCHNHGDESAIKASGGFIVSEGQHNELMAGPHANNPLLPDGCVSCHNPHQKAEFGIKVECGTCHSEEASAYASNVMSKAGVECIDCHMAPATLSAQALGPNTGDMRSHIFYINTDPAANMFTQDGNNVALSGGKAAVTLDFACQRCHQGAALEELAKFAKDFHESDKTLEDVGLTPGLTGHWFDSGHDGEGFMLHFGNAGDVLTLFASFYTYAPDGGQVWLVALSNSINGTTANVTVYVTTGDRSWGATTGNFTEEWGTGSFSFTDCENGTMSLTPNATYEAAGFTPLTYDINRTDFPITSEVACPTFVNNSE